MHTEAEITAGFLSLGYTPRALQVEAVQDVLAAFELGKRFVFLDAPCGSGKSLLALVIRKLLNKRAVIVTATNALGEQYERDYSTIEAKDSVREARGTWKAEHVGLPLVMGADQYPCEVRRIKFHNQATAGSCYRKSRYFYTNFLTEPVECSTCKFSITRQRKHEDVSVTNYPYYIIDQLYVKPMGGSHGEKDNPSSWHDVDLGIFDEAHLINEQFAQHYVIFYSIERGQEYLSDIRKALGVHSKYEAAYANVFRIIDENIKRGSIGPNNHMRFVDMLGKFYRNFHDLCETMQMYAKEEARYDQLGALSHKYHNLFCKIDDYHKYKYEVVIDVKKGEGSMAVQPIFIGELSQELLQEHNLFMSATINYEFMLKTMALDPEECQLVKVAYSFQPDDKTIDFRRARSFINYANMYSDVTIYSFLEAIEAILADHPTDNGVVIANSFKMAEELAGVLSSTHEIMLHTSAEPAKEIILRFKQATKPTLLLSPSLFEGVDFPGAVSRFQILPKAPYLSLAAKRMYYISRKHRGVYLQMSIKRMIQAFGRSSRASGDKAVTYVLDLNAEKLFRSKHNTWKEQFTVIR